MSELLLKLLETIPDEVLIAASGVVVLLFLLLLVRLSRPRFPKTMHGRVVYVCDGDTVYLKTFFKRHKLRLAGMDAPETAQPYGKESQKYLSDLVLNRTVQVLVLDIDIYGRYVSQIHYNGTDISLEMIRSGMAWPYYRFFSRLNAQDRRIYESAGWEARHRRRGLWIDKTAVAPWTWRRQHRSLWAQIMIWLRRILRCLLGYRR